MPAKINSKRGRAYGKGSSGRFHRFCGGNLAAKHAFAAVCHSTDIAAQFGAKPDLCVYAGVPAAMFLANADPDADLAVMAAARENLRQIAPKQLVLISSIAVYADSRGKDEQSPMTPDGLPAYGRNRLQLERWAREDYPNALIVRLPALYGIGLKKNFLFVLHTITPAMLKPEKYTELAQKSPWYGMAIPWQITAFISSTVRWMPRPCGNFLRAMILTPLPSRIPAARYQFYHLARLWQDVQTALQNGLTTLNLTTPPVTAAEVYTTVTGKADWQNELPKPPFDYDLRSRACCAAGRGGRIPVHKTAGAG